MSYGLDNYVNKKVSAPIFISALDKIGMDVKKKKTILFIYFLLVMVYACNQNSWLQLNIF